MTAPLTVAAALRGAIPRLRAAGIDDPARDARALMAHVLEIEPGRLVLHGADPLDGAREAAFEAALRARAARQPVAQIIGSRWFHGICLEVTRDTLDPRPETEALVEAAISRPFFKMLDLGTGTGAILLACLRAMPAATGTGTDISPAALAVAEGNARRLGLAGRARFIRADWFSGISGRFDLIVSNPPYIARDEMAGLAPEVRDWEPHLALTPGADGLAACRIIARGALSRLMPGGRLLLETGPTQGAAVCALLAASGLPGARILPDLDGRDRVVLAEAPPAGGPDRCGCT